MSIIEKLGITPIEEHDEPVEIVCADEECQCIFEENYKTYDPDEVLDLEQQRDEMLESIIYFIKSSRGAIEDNHWADETGDIIMDMISIFLLDTIQKATGKTWPEIKELL